MVNTMCASSAPTREHCVYKRRKLPQSAFAFLSEENATSITKESSNYTSTISFELDPLSVKKDDLEKTPVTSAEVSTDATDIEYLLSTEDHHPREPNDIASKEINCSISKPVAANSCLHRANELPPISSTGDFHLSTLEHFSVIHDTCSSSKSITEHCTASKQTEADDTGECSSTENVSGKSLDEFTSAKDLCIYVLRSHGLLDDSCRGNAVASVDVLGDVDEQFMQSCKICGIPENPRKMLLCDLCDEAFHISCCIPKIKKLLIDEWYCLPCLRKRPKTFLVNNSGKSFNKAGGSSEGTGGNPISFMLSDTQPYTTGVRIGRDFQVEVPEWCGPVSVENDYFRETSQLDPTEFTSLEAWNYKPFNHNSIGNWIQCREVIYNDANDGEGTICGKWRRAPLFAVQADDWDCSCSVTWDPIHADCAVPQELETDVILKHLKYIQMLRPRLANNRWKSDQNKI